MIRGKVYIYIYRSRSSKAMVDMERQHKAVAVCFLNFELVPNRKSNSRNHVHVCNTHL